MSDSAIGYELNVNESMTLIYVFKTVLLDTYIKQGLVKISWQML